MGKTIKAMGVSWKTTIAGVIAFAIIALQAAQLLLDGDPNTNPDWNLVVAEAMIMIGLLTARDNDKTSEEVRGQQRAPRTHRVGAPGLK